MTQPKTKRKLPSSIKWILWVIVVQLILFNISAAFYAYKFTHFYREKDDQVSYADGNVFTKTWKLFTGPKFSKSINTQFPDFTVDIVTLKTKKGDLIDAWYGKTDSVAKGTVLLFHGVTSNKSQIITEAAAFRFMGYDVMLVDFRGHGKSSGFTTTIGFKEAEEVKLAYDFVQKKGEKNIILWGTSMGSVAIAHAVAEYALEPAAVILEMPFAPLQDHLKARSFTRRTT